MGRGVHCTPEKRKIIRALRDEGHTQREIARIVQCSKKMVENALKPQSNTENRGGKRKTTLQMDRQIVRLSKGDPFKPASAIKNELNLPIHVRTVRRRLVENHLHGRIAKKVPLLSKINIKKRLAFAEDHVHWRGPQDIKKWRNILWSDEVKINIIGSDGRRYVRRPTNQELNPKYRLSNMEEVVLCYGEAFPGTGQVPFTGLNRSWTKINICQHSSNCYVAVC